MRIEYRERTDLAGLELYDPIEQRHVGISTADQIHPTETDPGVFPAPVDAAWSFETTSISFDTLYQVDLHGPEGTFVDTIAGNHHATFDLGTPLLGINGPMKLFVRVDQPGRINTDLERFTIDLEAAATVELGARSLHDRPAGTIVTPDEPEPMMTAIEALASSLKTTDPDRSWPTLRGHPPLIERGTSLEVPDGLGVPTTDVTIEVPPGWEELYTVTPLAYYLGASLESSESVAIRTGTGQTHVLGTERPLAQDVERTLKRVFLLDCLAREGGTYPIALAEREDLLDELSFRPAALFHDSVGERLESYLQVPYRSIEPHFPRWPLQVDLAPVPASVEVLPFVANELGLVRTVTSRDRPRTSANTAPATFARSSRDETASGEPSVSPEIRSLEEPIETARYGGTAPTGASAVVPAAYRNQLEREATSETIEILVVCNDPRMLEEQEVLASVYGERTDRAFDVTSAFGTSCAELAVLLEDGRYDFVHYVGHATEAGLECHDGRLDVTEIESVSIGAFFLNACASYDQGIALVERGAVGGVCTYDDVDNAHAVSMGEAVARLMNLGFTLRGALQVADQYVATLEQYVIVGDGSADIVQTDGGAPLVLEIRETRGGYECDMVTFPTKEFGVGSVVTEMVTGENAGYLHPGTARGLVASPADLEEFLTWTRQPIVYEDELYWNDDYLESVLDF